MAAIQVEPAHGVTAQAGAVTHEATRERWPSLTLAVLAVAAVIGASVTPPAAGHMRVHDHQGLMSPASPRHVQGARVRRTMAIRTRR
jgi:hypothetical protein